MSDQSVHDNNVYTYSVLCEQQQIILHTEYRDGSAEEYTDVIFNGVIAHHFECVLPGNILFGIDEVGPDQIVNEWTDLFARQKNFGWPAIDYNDSETLISILRQRGIKGFEIGSSYGLSGWVLASSMEREARGGRFSQTR